MIQRVRHPQPELRLGEERVPLAEHIQLWVPIEDTRGDELIEDADDEWWEDGEDDVVE